MQGAYQKKRIIFMVDQKLLSDIDPLETKDWVDSIESVLETEGEERAHFLIEKVIERAHRDGVKIPFTGTTEYINTIPADKQPRYPGNSELEHTIRSYIRWNAMAVIVRSNAIDSSLGGHIASYASLATMWEVGFNHIEDGIRAGKIQMNRMFFEDDRLIANIMHEIQNQDATMEAVWGKCKPADIRIMVSRVLEEYLTEWESIYKKYGRESSRTRREMKARWVSRFAGQVGIIDDARSGWKRVTFVRDGQEDLDLLRTMEILKKLAWVTMVKDFRVQRLQKRSEIIIEKLWESFKDYDTGSLILPPDWIENHRRNRDIWPWHRLAADYIAGMTDLYAEKVYTELFASRSGSIYERD